MSSAVDNFNDIDDFDLLEGLSLQEIEELSAAIDPQVNCYDVLEAHSDSDSTNVLIDQIYSNMTLKFL